MKVLREGKTIFINLVFVIVVKKKNRKYNKKFKFNISNMKSTMETGYKFLKNRKCYFTFKLIINCPQN